MNLRFLACKPRISCAPMLMAPNGHSASVLRKSGFSAQTPQVHNTLYTETALIGLGALRNQAAWHATPQRGWMRVLPWPHAARRMLSCIFKMACSGHSIRKDGLQRAFSWACAIAMPLQIIVLPCSRAIIRKPVPKPVWNLVF